MTDHMERAVQTIAARKNGSPKTTDDVFELVLALADDTDAQHEESMTAVAELRTDYDQHVEFAKERDRQIAELRARQNQCPEAIEAAIRAEHAAVIEQHRQTHARHMADEHEVKRASDPVDSAEYMKRANDGTLSDPETERTQRRVWVMWAIGIWFANLAGTTIVVYLLDRLMRP